MVGTQQKGGSYIKHTSSYFMYRQFMSTGGVKVSVCSQLVSTKICPLRTLAQKLGRLSRLKEQSGLPGVGTAVASLNTMRQGFRMHSLSLYGE